MFSDNSYMATIDDIITITTKASSGHYVQRPAETFNAIKLDIPEIAGISDKLYLHVLRMDRFERMLIPLAKIESINGKTISKPVTEWKVKDYVIRLTGSGYRCSCPGFRFKKKCSHIEQIKLTLQN